MTVLQGHTLSRYINHQAIVEISSLTGDLLVPMLVQFLAKNPTEEVLLLQQLPTTIQRLRII